MLVSPCILVVLSCASLASSDPGSEPSMDTRPMGGMVYDDMHNHEGDHGLDSKMLEENYKVKEDEYKEYKLQKFRQDVEHIKEHLREKMDLSKIDWDKLEQEELDWLFFKLHDVNDDRLLDGLEFLTSLEHALHGRVDRMGREGKKPSEVYKVYQAWRNSFVKIIDDVYEHEDTDNDGYLTYLEYAKARTAKAFLQNR